MKISLLHLFVLLPIILAGQAENCGVANDADQDGLFGCADPDCSLFIDCNNTFTCEEQSRLYQVLEGNVFVEYSTATLSYLTLNTNTATVNAIGYNVQDGYVYGIRSGNPVNNHLIRIGADGVFTDLGDVDGLPTDGGAFYFTGDFDLQGNLYVMRSNMTAIYRISVASRSVVQTYLLPPGARPASDFSYVILDPTNPTEGAFFGLSSNGWRLQKFDPADGSYTDLGPVSSVISCGQNSGFGATFSDRDGFLYAFCNSSGELFRVDICDMSATSVQQTGIRIRANDGAGCALGGSPIVLNPTVTICEGESYRGRTVTGAYADTLVSVAGCARIRSFELEVLPFGPSRDTSVVICAGESFQGYDTGGTYPDTFFIDGQCRVLTLELRVDEPSSSVQTVNLCPGGSFFFQGQEIRTSGEYDFIVANANGCDSLIQFQVTAETVDFLGPDTVICNASSYLLRSGEETTRWSDGSSGADLLVTETDRYAASFQRLDGCEVRDTISITFAGRQPYLPTAFSPNFDGVNDTWAPIFPSGSPPNYQLTIFDRWGGMVFQGDNQSWAGTRNLEAASTGIYVYQITVAEGQCATQILSGAILLIR
ncbi:MAG: gliding motility-associated C-terminal domain-containing protein [Bacteroidota bacterium]